MATKTRERLITSDELAAMTLDEACELEDGRILPVSPAGRRPARLVGRLFTLLSAHVARKKLGLATSGEAGFLVRRDPDTVRAPDIAFISAERDASADEHDGAYYPFAPDLAIEVLSPDDTWKRVERKVGEYLGAGGKAVWIVNPDSETVHVYEPGHVRVLTKKDRLDGGKAIPGFKAPLKDVF